MRSAKSVEVQASRLLRNAKVRAAIEAEMQARRERLQVDADTVVREFARIAFANARDYIPCKGEEFDFHRLNIDQTAAVERVEVEDVIDARTGDIVRRVRVKLHDKVAALNSLAKHLSMLTDRQVIEGTIEHRVAQMTPEERVERVRQLREKERLEYWPKYEAALKTIDGAAMRSMAERGRHV